MDRRVRTHGKSARYACNSDSAKRSQRRGRSALWAEKTRTPNRQGVLRGSWTGAGSSRCQCAWGSQVTLARPRKTWGEPPRDLCSRHSPVAASWHFGSTRLTLAAKTTRWQPGPPTGLPFPHLLSEPEHHPPARPRGAPDLASHHSFPLCLLCC